MKGPIPGGNERITCDTDDFVKAVTGSRFVDKTLLMEEVLKDPAEVIMITRPEGFGKSLNLDMLRVFFEKTDRDTSVHFRERKIWQRGETIQREQGKYPVIHITLKDVKDGDHETAIRRISSIIGDEYRRHEDVLSSPALSDRDRRYFRKCMESGLSETETEDSLKRLSDILAKAYGENCFILIDDCDVPETAARQNGCCDRMKSFMSMLLSISLKGNYSLKKGILTGKARVGRGSIFGGFNNLRVYGIMDKRYSDSFGFTEEEVGHIAEDCHAKDRMAEITAWYGGYRHAGKDMYSPLSVASYLNDGMEPRCYRKDSEAGHLLRKLFSGDAGNTMDDIRTLIEGGTTVARMDTPLPDRDGEYSLGNIYSLLTASGFLTPADDDRRSRDIVSLRIPDLEMKEFWKTELMQYEGTDS